MWSEYQRNRLALEKQILELNGFSNFYFNNPRDDQKCYLNGYLSSSTTYYVHVYLKNFPFEPPQVTIVSPTLYDFCGKRLIDKGAGHSTHTLSPINNELHLCLFRSERWTQNNNIIDVLLKANYWIQAYEAHKKTGLSISYYCN